jgi:thioredoxin reductase (NADPH)
MAGILLISMSETSLNYLIALLILAVPLCIYLRYLKKREARTREAIEEGKMFPGKPKAQHPRIDLGLCIGCGACVRACPEGDVLGLFAGKASIIKAHKCVGHGLCEDSCPVGAIIMVLAAPSAGADLPYLTTELETSIPNLFIAGELGGLALIKNAVEQGRQCVDTIMARIESGSILRSRDIYDVCVVGAGPAGISASLRAIQRGLHYLTLEQGDIGGTVSKYPRQKLVMTSPVEFPIYGRFRKMTLSKEELLEFWHKVGARADFSAHTQERVETIDRDAEGIFTVATTQAQYRSATVILALGRNGTPRKLGVKGEELPKVMYSLIETEAYQNSNILIVGGGDSAVEAALGLSIQKGNRIVLSYRKDRFFRIKERNALRIEECIRSGSVQVLFNSNPEEIREKSVILKCGEDSVEMDNDYVWIFAGGVSPNSFLGKIGVRLGTRDIEADPATGA